ncbi:hypothetical protein JS530_00730 [Bifidobacterium sp. LC6]|uniref:Uncharacterized protein n=1 Tax=Bifidobacterium colobi TaxID=2809026 RepID=A0ABS5UTF4_9BIFI|nr:hypothetical protein [Bifidobacterium colobi]MBT1174056.1 hypothetical protein [Bifidobacterium colobi]
MTNPIPMPNPAVPMPQQAGKAPQPKPQSQPQSQVPAADALLAAIGTNFGGESTDAIAKAKKNSLAEMNKSLPEWSLEPPETFLS